MTRERETARQGCRQAGRHAWYNQRVYAGSGDGDRTAGIRE